VAVEKNIISGGFNARQNLILFRLSSNISPLLPIEMADFNILSTEINKLIVMKNVEYNKKTTEVRDQ